MRKLLVLGGTGFIGREICRRAIQLGFQVTSLSRRGRISGSYLTAEDVCVWESKVTWKTGNAVDAGVVGPLILKSDAVIHSIGILQESSLNELLSGGATSAAGLSYHEANRNTATVPLQMLASQKKNGATGARPFVFISAESGFPFSASFLESKRQVETLMQDYHEQQKIRSIIFRPGIVYHHYKWTSLPISCIATAAYRLDQKFQKTMGLSVGLTEPTPLDLLATAALRSVALPTESGIFKNDEMWSLTRAHEI